MMRNQEIVEQKTDDYARKYAEQHHITVEEAKQSQMYKNFVSYCEQEFGYEVSDD